MNDFLSHLRCSPYGVERRWDDLWVCVSERVDRVYMHARKVIDGLGHATWSATVPVSRS